MHNGRWNTILVCYVAIEKWKFKVTCTCLLRSYVKIMVPNTLQSNNIWGSMSQWPNIILSICTKQINFPRNSSEGHFRTSSLSWYSFSDPQMTRVARLCIASVLLMCFTKYGFQTWQRNHIPKLDALRSYMLSRLLLPWTKGSPYQTLLFRNCIIPSKLSRLLVTRDGGKLSRVGELSLESFSASRLRKQLQSAPMPQLVPKTRGVKDPISTSSNLFWYFRFFSSSCSLKSADVAFPCLHLELTCVTLTSKNAVTSRDQKPPALKSSLASGLVTALLRLNRSLSRGCSCGSTSTLVQTLPISEVSRLRTPSCLCATNPPFLHDRAWQTVYFSPQTHLPGKTWARTLVSRLVNWRQQIRG